MSAAFDTVNIQKLLNILEHKIGLTGTVLQWFRSFLLGRKQKVLISGQLSEALLTFLLLTSFYLNKFQTVTAWSRSLI